MPHAALWVVQLSGASIASPLLAFQCRTRLCGWCSEKAAELVKAHLKFQCRTRLCGWCSKNLDGIIHILWGFNAARGFVGGAAKNQDEDEGEGDLVSMPHAALWVVQPGKSRY